MSISSLEVFVHEVMAINATISGMGGSYAGIIGTAAPSDQTIFQLKKTIIAFASECHKDKPDETKISEFCKEIEAFLSTLQITSVITNVKYEQLITDLKNLCKQYLHLDRNGEII